MRSQSAIRVGLAVLLLITLGGCKRYEQEFLVRNDLDVPILTITSDDPDAPTGFLPEAFEDVGIEPGGSEQVGMGLDEPGFPWTIWPFSHWVEIPCRDDLYLIVESQDGRRFVHEPPLCIDDVWTISD